MNKIYKPFFSLSRMLYLSTLNNHIVQKLPQKKFSERVMLEMRQIENIWRRSKDTTALKKYLYKCYMEHSELLTYATDLINVACSRSSPSPCLVFELVKAFNNYIEENNLSLSSSVEQNVCILSSVLRTKNSQVIELVCSVFKLHDQPLLYRQYIEDLIQERRYAEAANLVSALQLQKEFDFKEILLPLLLEGNVHSSITYMTNYPDIQLKAVKVLDAYLDNNDYNTAESQSRPKKIFKTLSSLIHVFKISLDTCPNMKFIRSKGAINHLIKRRKENSVSEENWIEMIKDIVGDSEDLKIHLIKKLVLKNDVKSIIKTAKIFNISIEDLDLSESIKEEISKLNDGDSVDCNSQNFDICNISDEYLKLPLEMENIKIIDNKEDFINCLDDICQNYKILGIDSEWKPHFGLSTDRLSLIQLAVHDKIYILDFLLLSECLDTEHWDKLMDDIFGNPNLIKLGCGITSDIIMILEGSKGTKGKSILFSHILDMAIFYEKLQSVYPVEMHHDSEKSFTRSLSSLCDVVLGKPLSKEDCLCDWEQRPLTEKQLEYAALDAHCLLQIYDKLKNDSVAKEMNFAHQARLAIKLTIDGWKPKTKFKVTKNIESVRISIPFPVWQLKVAMDSVFEKQAKDLMKLGADVVILPDINPEKTAIELSEKEGRLIICSTKLYPKVKYQIKWGFRYGFSKLNDNQVEVIHLLQMFNAEVSTENSFLHCLNCNSDQRLKLSKEDHRILQELLKTHTSMNSVLQDNLSSFSSELQTVLSDILNSNITINISNQNRPSFVNEYSFLCKNCGNIS